MRTNYGFIGGFFLMAAGLLCVPPVIAGDDLSIAVTISNGDRYIEPLDKQFELVFQPMTLFIRVRNISEESQEVNHEADKAYSFELIDENGVKTLMQPKRELGEDKPTGTYRNIGPDEEQVTEIKIDPETWEGVPDVVPDQKRIFKLRALYLNADGKTLYSPEYTLIINLH